MAYNLLNNEMALLDFEIKIVYNLYIKIKIKKYCLKINLLNFSDLDGTPCTCKYNIIYVSYIIFLSILF